MTQTNTVEEIVAQPYKYGFTTEIETEKIPKGLNEDVIRLISAKKNEPDFLLKFRLRAYEQWLKMKEPDWSGLTYSKVDYQDLVYYAAPKQDIKKKSLDEVDPKLLETFEKLGIPLSEQKRLSNVAVDAVFDSVSIATTYKEKLAEHGVIFCSISEAIIERPDLIEKYMGTVVPINDNFFAAIERISVNASGKLKSIITSDPENTLAVSCVAAMEIGSLPTIDPISRPIIGLF